MEPFLGEIRPFGFDFAPRDWALCNGQLLQIAQYSALFSILGTTYGGDGQRTFALPNIQGRVIIGPGKNPSGGDYVLGEAAGRATVTLTQAELPTHNHVLQGAVIEGLGNLLKQPTPGSSYLSNVAAKPTPTSPSGALGRGYANTPVANSYLNPGTLALSGHGEAHENMMPYLTINYCIALSGIFPQRP